MSFILNALRKSEQERLSNHVETLEDKILLKHGSVQKNHPGWLLILILILINVLLIAFFLLHFTQQEEKVFAEKPVAVAEQLKTPVHTEEDEPIIVTERPVIAAKQAKTPAQINEEKAAQVQDVRLLNTPQVSIAQQIKNNQQKVIHKPAVSLKTERTIKPPKVKQVLPIESTKSSVEQEVKKPKPDLVVSNKENDPPYLSDMPYDFQLSVPNININVFVYTKDPANRFIMVNMQKYLAGQQINEEMQLQEIRQDSFVVKYQGEVFQIRQ